MRQESKKPKQRFWSFAVPSPSTPTEKESLLDLISRPILTGAEVKRLNFIRDSSKFHFRRYYRQGLRSHIFEILDQKSIVKEAIGEIRNGVHWFPPAVPRHMLRILRTRFDNLQQALCEIEKYDLLLKSLGPELIARSTEFVVSYTGAKKPDLVLCGLQEFISGTALDPWALYGAYPLQTFFMSHFGKNGPFEKWQPRILEAFKLFIDRTRRMVSQSGIIPDLAGNGNLIISPSGNLKLVDINNIIPIDPGGPVLLDDKGYPSADKSMEVLFILEKRILASSGVTRDPLYAPFRVPERLEDVKVFQKRFFQNL